MQNNNLFQSDDLTFVATIILLDKATIEKVLYHPQKSGVKIFCLSPKNEVESLYKLYVSDKLQVSPQRLNAKIAAIRYLPVDEERRSW